MLELIFQTRDLSSFIPQLTQGQWTLHILIFGLNLLLFLFATPLLKLIDPDTKPAKVRMFQGLNILFLGLHATDLLLLGANSNYQHYFINLGYTLVVIYLTMLIYSIFGALTKRRFGRKKTVDEKTVFVETYSSRLVNLVMLVIIWFTAIYALIKIWGADSLLETTGVYGIIAAFLAFTSSIWAPDILSGLIILNSDTIEDGDVVKIDGHPNEYVISRITLIYMVLYDIRQNNRAIIRNSKFMDQRVDNYSRVASTRGLRQSIVYKIGYPQFTGHRQARLEQLAAFKKNIDDMFSTANEACKEKEDIKINESKPFDWALTSTGDYALEYTLWVYLERIPSTKITRAIRQHLIGTLFKVNEAIYDASIAEDIDLSTPDVLSVNVAKPPSLATSSPPVKQAPKSAKGGDLIA